MTVALAAWLGGNLVYRDGVFVKLGEDPASRKSETGATSGDSHHH